MDDSDESFFSPSERQFLTALNQLEVEYLVVGMSAALLQGARGATEDVDLWFKDISDPRIGEAAKRASSFWITRMQPPMLGGKLGERFDVVLNMSGLPYFSQEYPHAKNEMVDGIPLKLLPLERILHSKRSSARAKDEPGIRQIEIALKIIQAKTE